MRKKFRLGLLTLQRLMAHQFREACYIEVILITFTVLLCFLWEGGKGLFVKRTIDVETYLPVILKGEVSRYSKQDTVCAQAVIERSNIANGGFTVVLGNIELPSYPEIFWSDCEEIYRDAVETTKGCLIIDGGSARACKIPFCRASAGKTRSGEENLGSDYAYLTAVESEADKKYEKYLNKKVISYKKLQKIMERTFPAQSFSENGVKNIEILSRDESGYVKEIRIESAAISGEEFRKLLQLSSSNLEIKKKKNKVVISSRGVGHGFGYSQYGGEQMAKSGKNWEEILLYYFPKMKLSEIE